MRPKASDARHVNRRKLAKISIVVVLLAFLAAYVWLLDIVGVMAIDVSITIALVVGGFVALLLSRRR